MKLSIIPSKEYPESLKYTRHELKIQDWVAKEKEIFNRQKQEVEIIDESELAYQIKFKNGVQEEIWIPKSQCRIIERKEVSFDRFA